MFFHVWFSGWMQGRLQMTIALWRALWEVGTCFCNLGSHEIFLGFDCKSLACSLLFSSVSSGHWSAGLFSGVDGLSTLSPRSPDSLFSYSLDKFSFYGGWGWGRGGEWSKGPHSIALQGLFLNARVSDSPGSGVFRFSQLEPN